MLMKIVTFYGGLLVVAVVLGVYLLASNIVKKVAYGNVSFSNSKAIKAAGYVANGVVSFASTVAIMYLFQNIFLK